MRGVVAGAILGLMLAGPLSARAADLPSGTTLVTPDETEAPPRDPSRLILPGQPDRPGVPVPTLPPSWLVPLPDAATRATERAQFDAALEARFARVEPPPQGFDLDVVPLAAGQPWQALQRRVDGTLGSEIRGPEFR